MTKLTRLLALTTVLSVLLAPPSLAGATARRAERVISGSPYGFNNPVSIVVRGADVWVLNSHLGDKHGDGLGTVTELRATNGALVRLIKGPSFDFDYPSGMAMSARDLWVANAGNNSVTEIDAASGKLVRVLAGTNFAFDEPDAIASVGSHVWVASFKSSTLTEINASTGTKTREIISEVPGPNGPIATNGDDILNPQAISSNGSHLWVLSGESITELHADTGALVRVISSPSSALDSGRSFVLAAGKSRLWVANGSALSVFSARTGKFLKSVHGSAYGFKNLDSITVGFNRVWVGEGIFRKEGAVLELNGTTGALIAQFRGPHFDFSDPGSVALEATHAWIADSSTNLVIELAAH